MMWIILISVAIIAIPLTVEYNRSPMDDARRGSAPGLFAELSQGVTHYEWLGPPRGPVAVCIHGLTTPSFVFRSLVRGLALMGFRVLVYDLYGRGFSDRPRGEQDRRFFLRQLGELLEREQVGGDLTVIGYSMGGAIATCFAADNPGRVRQLVLLAPAGMGMRLGKLARFIVDVPILGDWVMLAVYAHQQRKALRAEAGVPSSIPNITELQEAELDYKGYVPSVLASLRGILSEKLESEHATLQRHHIPVLAIWGGEDTVIPPGAMGRMAEWHRDAKHEVIEEAGHGLPYTHTEAVLAAMQRFLRTGH